MPKPHAGYEAVSKYLSNSFPWKGNLFLEDEEFTYEEVITALKRLKKTDPNLHRMLAYKWATSRSRNDIACFFKMDSSTLKRLWNKALDILVNHLRHGEREDNIAPPLDAIDILSEYNR